MRRRARVWPDGESWERDEWEHTRNLAVAIPGSDIRLISQLTRHCEQARRRGRPDMVHGYGLEEEARFRRLVRDLFERAGTATVTQENPQTVPLTLAEIKKVERLRDQIQYLTSYYLHDHRDPLLDQADDLLNRLHFLAGHAKATSVRGGVTVFRPEPRLRVWLRPQLTTPER